MSKDFRLARRDFLILAAAFGLSAGTRAMGVPVPGHRSLAPDEFKHRLRGPIVSIPTPFTANLKVDDEAIGRMIRRALDYDIHVFCLTTANSQYASLSFDEIKELVRVVAEAVGDLGITIAGSGPWWTARLVEFTRYAESMGATAVMVLLPTGVSDVDLVRHFQQLDRSSRLPIVLQGNFPLPLLERLTKIDSIAALKEDVSERYFLETQMHFGERLNCFAGGSYEFFVVGQPYGSTAYFDTYSSFYPEISARFWKAVQANDYAAERDLIEKYDHPLIFHEFSHAFWHATLEYFGIAGRYMRPPQHTFTDEEMKGVKAFYDKVGIHPEKPTS
jgi:dihydrodipicolinate synthase/N-acetylneuraminate lyase